MIKKEEKRGSHVEIMISFIIFVTFVLFLLAILMPPISTQKDKKNIFEGIETEIINQVSSNMTVISVNLGDSDEDCVNLDNLLDNLGIGENIIVKDSSGNEVSANIDGSSLRINRDSTEDKFFKIYYSQEFEGLSGDSGCEIVDYDVRFAKNSEYIFQNKFNELINEDYKTVKSEINAPDGVEFGYGIILSDGTTLETSNYAPSTNIYVKETPIEYVDNNGNLKEGYIKTKIW